MAAQPMGDVRPDRTTLGAFLAVVLIGGSNGVAVKLTVLELAPLWSAALRFVVAGAIMVAIVVAARRSFPRGGALLGAVIFGVLGFGASYGLIYPSVRTTPVGTTMVLIALAPLLTLALAVAHRQERFRLQALLGAAIAVAGIALVFAEQVSADVPVSSLLFVVLGAVCIAESAVVLKLTPRSDPFGTNAVGMLTGAALLVAVSLVLGERWALPATNETWLAIAYLIVLGSVVMFALYVFTLRRWTASGVSYATLLFPLVTVPLATLLAGEAITPALVIGGSVILVGVYVGAFAQFRPRAPAAAIPECAAANAGAAAAREPA